MVRSVTNAIRRHGDDLVIAGGSPAEGELFKSAGKLDITADGVVCLVANEARKGGMPVSPQTLGAVASSKA